MIRNRRINNLEFCPMGYLGKKPEHPAWAIDKIYPNKYFGKESEYKKIDENYYQDNKYPCKIHKSCFKYPESRCVIASFECDREGYYELHYCGSRPLDLSVEENEDFQELIRYGYKVLNEEYI